MKQRTARTPSISRQIKRKRPPVETAGAPKRNRKLDTAKNMSTETNTAPEVKPAHTPGPWVFDGHVAIHHGHPHKPHTLVALVYSCAGGGLRANARLIAAAPELLAGLQWCIRQMQGESGAGENYWEQFPEYVAACAAIESATAKETAAHV